MARARRHAIALTVPLLAALLGPGALHVAATATATFITVEREVQPSSTYHRQFMQGSANFGGGASASTVEVRATNLDGSNADIRMEAPLGETLAIGTYDDVLSDPTAEHPGLDLGVDNQSCGVTGGHFEVLEVPVFADDGAIESFAGTFTADCGGLLTTGVIAINATAPIAAIVADPVAIMNLPAGVVGIPGAPQTLNLSNPGTTTAHISSIAVAGSQPDSFFIDHDCLTIAAGATCPVSVTFRPSAGGQNAADLIVTSALWAHPRTFTLSGQATFAPATNTTAMTAKVIGALPYLDGEDVSGVTGTGSQCASEVQSVWYRYTTATIKRVQLDTLASNTATNIALYRGTPSALTFITCGEDVMWTGQDGLTFTAEPNVAYYINVIRAYPGDYGIVLKATEGGPDESVSAGPFSVQYATFYPYVDKYRDTVAIRGTRGEKASVAISIYNAAGSKVRSLAAGAASGAYSVAWNGKSTGGKAQPAGRYKVVQKVTDTWGNVLVDTRYVNLSKKRLVRHTYTKTVDAARFASRGHIGTGTISKSGSRYAGGTKLKAGADGAAGIAFSFTVPKAPIYQTIRFSVLGVGQVPPSIIGLQDWAECATYNDTCVDPWGAGPTSGWARVKGSLATNLSSSRRARGYIEVDSDLAKGQWVDLRDVRLEVVWGVLK